MDIMHYFLTFDRSDNKKKQSADELAMKIIVSYSPSSLCLTSSIPPFYSLDPELMGFHV